MEIPQILCANPCIDIIATVEKKDNVKFFGKDGKYIAIILIDKEGKEKIKLTLFNDVVNKAAELQVSAIIFSNFPIVNKITKLTVSSK